MIPRNTPQAIRDLPLLQWASGKTEARAVGLLNARFAGLTGFHSEVGRDEAFDQACAAAQVAQLDIRHPRQGSTPEIKRHWHLGERVSFRPITAGPPAPTMSGCLAGPNAQRTAEAGIGLAWPSGEKSRMAARGFLRAGETWVLVQLAVRSTMTDALLAALLEHYRVCAAADSLIKREQHPEPVTFHELTLPLVAGAEVAAGKGDKTSQITLFASAHPAEITRDYIVSSWRARALHDAALEAWPGIVAWAAGYRSGETNGDAHL
jgi:hypothetical protein